MDLLPYFSASMLDCFVNDEFAEADRDLSDSRDFYDYLPARTLSPYCLLQQLTLNSSWSCTGSCLVSVEVW